MDPIPPWKNPSDHVIDNGGVPDRSTLNCADCPWQIVWLPLTHAIGRPALIGMVLLPGGEVQPLRVSVT